MDSTPASTQNQTMASNSKTVNYITWVSLLVNVVMTLLKFFAGIVGHSTALVADAVHCFGDFLTDIVVLVGVVFWNRPPDEAHPHGHRRIETLVTIIIGIALAGAAIGLSYNAIMGVHGKPYTPPNAVALVAAAVSFFVKEGLFRWMVAGGRRIKSSAVIANAWHSRSDAFASIPPFLAVGGTMLFPQLTALDRIGAVMVSLIILHAAFKITLPAIAELMDQGASRKSRIEIERLAASVAGVKDIHAMRTRLLGGGLQVDLHIMLDPNTSIREGHRISHEVRNRLLCEGPEVIDVMVHLEPDDEARDDP
jgi:cation diffusion facilitator family transporter